MNNVARSCLILALLFSATPSLYAAAVTKPQIVAPNFDKKIEQIEFREISVGDALRILSEESNINIIASKKAADIPVTMFLRKVTAMDVIDAISKTYNLWYQFDEKSNFIRLYTVQEYRLEQVEFKKEETEVFTLKNAKNALDLAETIQNLFSGRVLLSYGQNQQQLMSDLQQRFARFDLIDKRTKQQFNFSSGSGAGANNTRNNQTSSNQSTSNQSSNSSNQRNNQNSTQTTTNRNQNSQQTDEFLDSTTKIVKQFQGGKEGENEGILAGDADENREFIDSSIRHQAPIYVGVIKHQNRVLVRTRDVDAMNEIKKIYGRLNVESSMLLMEVKVLSIDLSDGYNSLFDFKVKNLNSNVNPTISEGGAKPTTATDTAASAATKLLQSASGVFDPSFLATTVSNSFETRLQLLEKENRVTEVATPMLLTSNQEVSRFLVGTTIPVITGYLNGSTTSNATGTGVTGSTSTSTSQSGPVYEQRSIGNTLLLTPNINADGTVNIQIIIEQSDLIKNGATMLFSSGESHTIDVVHEKTFSGAVMAVDGKSVAVGGLIQEGADNSENKVPILGDIPGLGFFFGDIAKNRTRTELVIIIKPHIINSPADAEAISKKMLGKNSIHPNAQKADNLDIYSNHNKEHKDYVLEKPYKEYRDQDMFDKYRDSNDSKRSENFSDDEKPRANDYDPNWQPRPRSAVAPQK